MVLWVDADQRLLAIAQASLRPARWLEQGSRAMRVAIRPEPFFRRHVLDRDRAAGATPIEQGPFALPIAPGAYGDVEGVDGFAVPPDEVVRANEVRSLAVARFQV